MTDIISTVQKQDPGSELVVLYELEYASGSFARFFSGLESDLTTVQFRDSSNTAREYTAIPITAEGFEINSSGAYSRPELSIGNIENAFSSAVGGLEYEDLTGKRVTRIITFAKYLVGGASDNSNAPGVCFPKTVYVIDQVKSKNIIEVVFSLAAPFDLAGVTLPNRIVVGGACTWRYKKGAASLPREDRIGGCSWEGFVGNIPSGTPVFVNSEDEYVMRFATTEVETSHSSIVNGKIYQTDAPTTVKKINADGSTSSVSGLKVYWQALTTSSSGHGTPSITNTNFRRVRRYAAPYSSSTELVGYTDPSFNDYVLKDNKLWRVRKTTMAGGAHGTVALGKYWIDGDICKKSFNSCKLRYQAKVSTFSGQTQFFVVSPSVDSNQHLPFGGFPGVQEKR